MDGLSFTLRFLSVVHPVPLTPALSQRERENSRQIVQTTRVLCQFHARTLRTLSGSSHGEGKRNDLTRHIRGSPNSESLPGNTGNLPIKLRISHHTPQANKTQVNFLAASSGTFTFVSPTSLMTV